MSIAPPPVAGAPAGVSPSAVAWIDRDEAIVATIDAAGIVTICEIGRGGLPEAGFLAHVVRSIGDRQRVLILGPGDMRLALEREYVAIFRRPDRLVDVEPAGPASVEDLRTRLCTLSG